MAVDGAGQRVEGEVEREFAVDGPDPRVAARVLGEDLSVDVPRQHDVVRVAVGEVRGGLGDPDLERGVGADGPVAGVPGVPVVADPQLVALGEGQEVVPWRVRVHGGGAAEGPGVGVDGECRW